MPHCWRSLVAAHIVCSIGYQSSLTDKRADNKNCCDWYQINSVSVLYLKAFDEPYLGNTLYGNFFFTIRNLKKLLGELFFSEKGK